MLWIVVWVKRRVDGSSDGCSDDCSDDDSDNMSDQMHALYTLLRPYLMSGVHDLVSASAGQESRI
jgi:hypothetical protein